MTPRLATLVASLSTLLGVAKATYVWQPGSFAHSTLSNLCYNTHTWTVYTMAHPSIAPTTTITTTFPVWVSTVTVAGTTEYEGHVISPLSVPTVMPSALISPPSGFDSQVSCSLFQLLLLSHTPTLHLAPVY
ncbi:hypothetical protein BDY21DRAFT_346818 [Lineolata rhizophorae]|uniref:Uncharacterized protein n=1 Tax=Lineolata rhizophorae TaxID=578093 RepID=A0A6A6NXA0_9PEZI|nr:hypothetical protein BDY21DRAFT_346818 [Lineolata rhizophorae]